jgi:hypothetical protein
MKQQSLLWPTVRKVAVAFLLLVTFLDYIGRVDVFLHLPDIVTKFVDLFANLPPWTKALFVIGGLFYFRWEERRGNNRIYVRADNVRDITAPKIDEKLAPLQGQMEELSRDMHALVMQKHLKMVFPMIEQSKNTFMQRWAELDQVARSKDIDWSSKQSDRYVDRVQMLNDFFMGLRTQAEGFGYVWNSPSLQTEYVPDELPHIPEGHPFKRTYKAAWIDAQKQLFYLMKYQQHLEKLGGEMGARISQRLLRKNP